MNEVLWRYQNSGNNRIVQTRDVFGLRSNANTETWLGNTSAWIWQNAKLDNTGNETEWLNKSINKIKTENSRSLHRKIWFHSWLHVESSPSGSFQFPSIFFIFSYTLPTYQVFRRASNAGWPLRSRPGCAKQSNLSLWLGISLSVGLIDTGWY